MHQRHTHTHTREFKPCSPHKFVSRGFYLLAFRWDRRDGERESDRVFPKTERERGREREREIKREEERDSTHQYRPTLYGYKQPSLLRGNNDVISFPFRIPMCV